MRLTITKISIILSLFLVLFFNYRFFVETQKVFLIDNGNFLFLISLAFVLFFVILIVLNLVGFKYIAKFFYIVILIVSSLVAYFANNYSIIIDTSMIRNILETNFNESADLLNIKLLLYFIFLGVIPSILILKIDIEYKSFFSELKERLKIIILAFIAMIIVMLTLNKHYFSFFREHQSLRYYTNPTYWIYSIGYYIYEQNRNKNHKFIILDKNPKIDTNESKIVIMVVGEAARADHFSLNGYKKITNEKLKSDNVINFSNFYSCGTSTAHSVPCMFSYYNRDNYSHDKAYYTQNVIDILKATKKVAILWRDNNSDSKGVALRVEYQDYKSPKNNKICDVECRDEGMLIGLKGFINKNRGKNVLIILHQMGNHGPAYYKRYPKNFEKFKPVCKTNELNKCTKEQINNAYDNAIYYTDYFLDKVIKFLSQFDKKSALIYMADHGESLGENGIYLHGLPYFIAPDAQKHIAALMWFNNKWDRDFIQKIQKRAKNQFTHDNLFHTLLGIFNVKSSVYKKSLDILTY